MGFSRRDILLEIQELERVYRAPDGPLAARIGGLCRAVRDERAGLWLERALKDDPGWQNRWNLTHWLWTIGELDRGFQLSRDILEKWHLETHPCCQKLALLRPGDDARGKRVLVTNYGGIGDLLHRCRHLEPLARAGYDCALHLSERCRGAADLMRVNGVLLAEDARGFDFWLPDTHIPELLGIYPATRSEGYLKADPERIGKWRAVLPPRFAAICWRNAPEAPNTHPRKLRGASLADVASQARDDLPLVSLQDALLTGETHPRLLQYPNDLDDMCAILGLAEQIVTIDGMPGNAAGALGLDFTVLLPPWPDWRWHHGATPNPWYRGARIRWMQEEEA